MSIVHLRTREQLHEVLSSQPVWIDYMQLPDGSRILLLEVEEDRFTILRQTGKPSCPKYDLI